MKADTGMSRLGWLCDEGHRTEAADAIAAVCALPGLEAEGIYTHFANADGDEAYTMGQFTRFLELLSELEGRGITFPIRHCAASAAVLKYPCTHLDMVRPGGGPVRPLSRPLLRGVGRRWPAAGNGA